MDIQNMAINIRNVDGDKTVVVTVDVSKNRVTLVATVYIPYELIKGLCLGEIELYVLKELKKSF